jgi:hypothetical protein
MNLKALDETFPSVENAEQSSHLEVVDDEANQAKFHSARPDFPHPRSGRLGPGNDELEPSTPTFWISPSSPSLSLQLLTILFPTKSK